MGVMLSKSSPARPSSTLSSSLWRGRVVEALADGTVWVLIPRLTGDTPIGPIPSLAADLQMDDGVLIGAIENSVNDLVVLARG